MGGMRGIGLMGNMMAMASRAGRGGVGTEGSIGRGCATDTVCISFTQGILMLESGAMGRVMALELRPALMGAAMLVNSSAVLNMALDATISGMEIDTPGSILAIKSMVLECITSPTAISTKGRGTRAGSRATECTPSGMVRPEAENGTTAISRSPSPRLLIQCFEQFRLLGKLRKVQSTSAGLMSK